MQIGSKIKQLRERRGFSQQVVADYLGMTQANYHKIESSKTEPKIEYLEKLAGFYDLSLADILAPDKNTVNIQNNNHNHNGVVMGDAQLFQSLLNAKDEIIKMKNERIAALENQILTFRKQ